MAGLPVGGFRACGGLQSQRHYEVTIDELRAQIKELRGLIASLEATLEAERTQRGEVSGNTTDLQRQIGEMEKIIKARFPDSAKALLYAASTGKQRKTFWCPTTSPECSQDHTCPGWGCDGQKIWHSLTHVRLPPLLALVCNAQARSTISSKLPPSWTALTVSFPCKKVTTACETSESKTTGCTGARVLQPIRGIFPPADIGGLTMPRSTTLALHWRN